MPFNIKHKKRLLGLVTVILVVLLLTTIGAGVSATSAEFQNIILIGWDGAGRSNIKELLALNKLPNLQALIDEGIIVAIDAERVTDTKAGWSAILTGYYPETTGVFSNTKYRSIPDGLTLFERLENYYGDDRIFTLFLSGKSKINNVSADVGYPFYNAKPDIDKYYAGDYPNEKIASWTLMAIENNYTGQMFLFVLFREPDFEGHTYGENSAQYANAIVDNDNWIGLIIQKLKDLGVYNNTLIYIVSDHGFDEGGYRHLDAPYEFLATNDVQVIRNGFRVDITPTIYNALGLLFGTDGHSLRQLYQQPVW